MFFGGTPFCICDNVFWMGSWALEPPSGFLRYMVATLSIKIWRKRKTMYLIKSQYMQMSFPELETKSNSILQFPNYIYKTKNRSLLAFRNWFFHWKQRIYICNHQVSLRRNSSHHFLTSLWKAAIWGLNWITCQSYIVFMSKDTPRTISLLQKSSMNETQ